MADTIKFNFFSTPLTKVIGDKVLFSPLGDYKMSPKKNDGCSGMCVLEGRSDVGKVRFSLFTAEFMECALRVARDSGINKKSRNLFPDTVLVFSCMRVHCCMSLGVPLRSGTLDGFRLTEEVKRTLNPLGLAPDCDYSLRKCIDMMYGVLNHQRVVCTYPRTLLKSLQGRMSSAKKRNEESKLAATEDAILKLLSLYQPSLKNGEPLEDPLHLLHEVCRDVMKIEDCLFKSTIDYLEDLRLKRSPIPSPSDPLVEGSVGPPTPPRKEKTIEVLPEPLCPPSSRPQFSESELDQIRQGLETGQKWVEDCEFLFNTSSNTFQLKDDPPKKKSLVNSSKKPAVGSPDAEIPQTKAPLDDPGPPSSDERIAAILSQRSLSAYDGAYAMDGSRLPAGYDSFAQFYLEFLETTLIEDTRPEYDLKHQKRHVVPVVHRFLLKYRRLNIGMVVSTLDSLLNGNLSVPFEHTVVNLPATCLHQLRLRHITALPFQERLKQATRILSGSNSASRDAISYEDDTYFESVVACLLSSNTMRIPSSASFSLESFMKRIKKRLLSSSISGFSRALDEKMPVGHYCHCVNEDFALDVDPSTERLAGADVEFKANLFEALEKPRLLRYNDNGRLFTVYSPPVTKSELLRALRDRYLIPEVVAPEEYRDVAQDVIKELPPIPCHNPIDVFSGHFFHDYASEFVVRKRYKLQQRLRFLSLASQLDAEVKTTADYAAALKRERSTYGSIIKNEVYLKDKPHRFIISPSDRMKILTGAVYGKVEEALCFDRNSYLKEHLIKHKTRADIKSVISSQFDNTSVAVTDHSQFEAHIGVQGLSWEHAVMARVCGGLFTDGGSVFAALAKSARSRFTMTNRYYKVTNVRAMRKSGLADTSIGNCILNDLHIRTAQRLAGVEFKSWLVEGDDALIAVPDRVSVDRFSEHAGCYNLKIEFHDHWHTASFCGFKLTDTGSLLIDEERFNFNSQFMTVYGRISAEQMAARAYAKMFAYMQCFDLTPEQASDARRVMIRERWKFGQEELMRALDEEGLFIIAPSSTALQSLISSYSRPKFIPRFPEILANLAKTWVIPDVSPTVDRYITELKDKVYQFSRIFSSDSK